ncbi:hypothetical protein RchiOBHm_Chr4g0391521 [Rosa chinensis]|uniref:Uncharacterized protein n=1 Tax=Rosa chinensis TaxID=74649 RepID=A0A2P6QQG8_ROSCH|nr:hypothetical protein RchiOBHm_Chr4g0391521 [Rosa chinensis]
MSIFIFFDSKYVLKGNTPVYNFSFKIDILSLLIRKLIRFDRRFSVQVSLSAASFQLILVSLRRSEISVLDLQSKALFSFSRSLAPSLFALITSLFLLLRLPP